MRSEALTMNRALPKDTGLDARFESELAAAQPGWVSGPSTPAVHHDPDRRRFVLNLEGNRAELTYESDAGTMVSTHTFVPPEFRGKGCAARLVRSALEHARTAKMAVVPRCSYVEAFITRHPEFADLKA